MCDSCRGPIGGPRLFCLDCAIKSTELYDSLDLCCAPKCVAARITHRRDIDGVHEPNHRLVKVRTTVLTRSHGRVHTAACNAFERVGDVCRKIAELTLHPGEETGTDEQNTLEPTPTKTPAKSHKPAGLPNRPDGAKDGANVKSKKPLESTNVLGLDQRLPTRRNCNRPLPCPFC